MRSFFSCIACNRVRWSCFHFALGLCLCFLTACHREPSIETVVQETLSLAEGRELSITFYRSAENRSPAILLLPGQKRSAAVWEAFARRLQQEGYALLVVDDRELSGRSVEEAFLHIDAARDRLLQENVHPLNLAVAGEGSAAGLALLYAARRPDMQATILLSPGLVHQEESLEACMAALKDCPSFVAASEGERYAAQAARVLKKAAPVYAELRLWPGTAHGTDLFAAHPEAAMQIYQWLKPILNAP
ncbi:MAG: hypothetical protein GX130_06690 [Candidatus Hydrogenedens sp.]|nr:hypothetical protein [Candidatus Hydrogenedens sp.]